MAVYGAQARMLNDLYFLNLDKPTTELHKSLACSKCRRVFRKPFGLERHFRQFHAGVGLEEAGELLESLERELLQSGKAARSEDGDGTGKRQEQQDVEDCDKDSSDDDEPIISSEEEDEADAAETPSPPETPAPASNVEVIQISSDEDEDDEDGAFIDSSDAASIVDSDADTLVEGDDDATDSGFESNKVSPCVGGTPEEERSESTRSWIASGGVKEEERSAKRQLPFCDPHGDFPEKKNNVAKKSMKDRSEQPGMGATVEDDEQVPIAVTERAERLKTEPKQKIEHVTQMNDKKVSGANYKEWTSGDMMNGKKNNESKKVLKKSVTKEAEAAFAAGENGQVVKHTKPSINDGQQKESSHHEAEECLPQESDNLRKRKMQSCGKAEYVSDQSNRDEDFPWTKAKKMSIDKRKPKEQHTKDMSKKVEIERLSVHGEKDREIQDGQRQMKEVQRSEPAQKNRFGRSTKPELVKNRFPLDPLSTAEKTDPIMRLKEEQKNKLPQSLGNLRESKIVDPGDNNNESERLGELARPKEWINSYKIPKVKPREGESRSPPSSSDGEKENTSPEPSFGSDKHRRHRQLPKVSGNVVKKRGILRDRGYPQKPKSSYEREVKWPGRSYDSRWKKTKRLRWREPLVKVFRFYSDQDCSEEGSGFTQESRREEEHIVEEVSSANAERIKIVERHVVSEYSQEANKNDTVKWEERIIKEIKTVLNPFYSTEKISTSTYKEIVRKCVPKIPQSSVINTVKVKRLVDAYVDRYTYEEKKRSDIRKTRTWGF